MAKRKRNVSTLAGDLPPRQRIWDAIRALHADGTPITLRDISLLQVEPLSDSLISDYLRNLFTGGFITRTNPDAPRATVAYYALIRDVGVEAPRVRRDGSLPPPPGREQLWRTLKIIGAFTGQDLADAASTPKVLVAKATADEYIKMLSRAGYLQTVVEPSPGVPGRYRLVPRHWTGPMAPMIRRTKDLYDPNIGEVIYSRVTKIEGGEP